MSNRSVIIKDSLGNVLPEPCATGSNLRETKGHAQHTMDTSRIFHSQKGVSATVCVDGKPVITYHKR